MMLATYLDRFPDELRADIQHYYGLCLDDAGKAYSFEHLACLAAQLPLKSRTLSALDPDNFWDLSDILQATLVNQFNDWLWAQAAANAKAAHRTPPKKVPHIGTKAMREQKKKEGRTITGVALPLDEFKKQLDQMRIDRDG